MQSCLGLLQPIHYQETGFLGAACQSGKNANSQWGIGHGASGIGHRAWGIGHRASGMGHRASGIGLAVNRQLTNTNDHPSATRAGKMTNDQ
ncbi:hypothetical protein QUB68_22465 [Microcoleus sp. A006_D1]|uniref:hypothetical protein n=1 Tax=Microcoleus sp. A006_D1 TaxID=3055267 RepID=UPI002FD1A6CF